MTSRANNLGDFNSHDPLSELPSPRVVSAAGGDGGAHPRLVTTDRGSLPYSRDQDHQLDLFHDRCCTLANRVIAGGIGFIDAVDLAYTAAQFSGLADCVGDDAVQAVMANAFMGCQS